jgi:hypothetical protein
MRSRNKQKQNNGKEFEFNDGKSENDSILKFHVFHGTSRDDVEQH